MKMKSKNTFFLNHFYSHDNYIPLDNSYISIIFNFYYVKKLIRFTII